MACIPGLDRNCNPLGNIATNTAQAFLKELATQAENAASDLIKTLFAGWLNVPSPGVDMDSGPVWYLRQYTHWAVAAVAVGAVLVAAIRLALRRNGEEAGNLGKGLAMMVILAGAGVPAVQLMLGAGDAYSTWVLNAAADGDAGGRLLLFAPVAGSAAVNGLTLLAALGISIMLWMAAFVQIILLLARGAAATILSGLLPLAGAVGISGAGRAVRDRYLTWTTAMVVYKPAAATVYAAAFWIIGKSPTNKGPVGDFENLLMGMVTFAMAVVALPALMRLIAPTVSVLTSNSGGGGVGAAAAAGSQLASGAMRVSEVHSSNSGGGGGGSGAPAGAAHTAPIGSAPGGGAASTGTEASTAGASAGSTAATSGAAAGGAAAAGPIGAGVMVAQKAYQSGPSAANKLGGTAASGATGGEEQ